MLVTPIITLTNSKYGVFSIAQPIKHKINTINESTIFPPKKPVNVSDTNRVSFIS